MFEFIAAKQAEHPVKTMCRVLEVSRSGFHAWRRRAPSARAREDARLTGRIREIHQANRQVYGSPRVHAELRLVDGERIGRKRVERLMRTAGLSGLQPRKWRRTTIRVPGVRVADDLLDRAFAADGPRRLDDRRGTTLDVLMRATARHNRQLFWLPARRALIVLMPARRRFSGRSSVY